MPRRHDSLFGAIANFQALHAAARRAGHGKRRKPGAAVLLRQSRRRAAGAGAAAAGRQLPARPLRRHSRSTTPRSASSRRRRSATAWCTMPCAPWSCPIFEARLHRPQLRQPRGKGTHRAIARYERYRDRHAHVLRCDIYRYFPAIDHAILKADFRRRIACERTLGLMDAHRRWLQSAGAGRAVLPRRRSVRRPIGAAAACRSAT